MWYGRVIFTLVAKIHRPSLAYTRPIETTPQLFMHEKSIIWLLYSGTSIRKRKTPSNTKIQTKENVIVLNRPRKVAIE